MAMNIALFVEGSGESVPSKRESGALARIWGELLPAALGCKSRPRVIPFSKRDLVALDRRKPAPTGALPFDVLLDRQLQAARSDAALVAWDLQPPWDPDAQRCRWQETLDLYRLLGDSTVLKDPWRARARLRFAALRARSRPNERLRPHQLAHGEVGVVCMEPMFEALLQDERGVLKALGLPRAPPEWPTRWQRAGLRDPDRALLAPAILAAKRSNKHDRIIEKIGGDMKTCKNEWGAYLLESLLAGKATRQRLVAHPLARRLRELLP